MERLKSRIERIEDHLESRPSARTIDPQVSPQSVDDIWLGRVFLGLKDHNHDAFYPGNGSELRLVFSLSVDGFDSFGGKIAKQKASSTGIWMVLLNFPPHLRYKPENMYIAGIIPGPSKPSNDEINHYIRLLVDELKLFWKHGVHFTRTYKHPRGRLTKAMVVPLVCDLLGARQVIGYASTPTAHYCCTFCDIDRDDINILVPTEWPRKDIDDIRRFAMHHRNAGTPGAQTAIFEGGGWRWSPLWELEYWNPITFTIIDSMHALDLNTLKKHCRRLFQIDPTAPSGDAWRPAPERSVPRVVNRKDDLNELRKCQETIFANSPYLPYELLRFERRVLYSFALDYDIRPANHTLVIGTRWVLAKNIYNWRQGNTSQLDLFLDRFPRFSFQQEELARSPGVPGEQLPMNEGLDHHDNAASVTETSTSSPINEAGEEDQIIPSDDSGNGEPEEQTPTVTPNNSNPSGNTAQGADQDGNGKSDLPKVTVLRRLAQRLVDLEIDDDESEEYKKLYKDLTIKVLVHFVDLLGLDRSAIRLASTQACKKSLLDLVLSEVQKGEDEAESFLEIFKPEDALPANQESSAFLGKDTMDLIREDMSRTVLPSWITPAPSDWGTIRRGKLSADNWRVICCIHLPITLIRLYGGTVGRRKELLDNFMDLVRAVRLATQPVITMEQIDQYEHHIFRYAQDVLRLYPDYSILPSLHAALHIGDMLRNFGPKHAHDSPHYERYIRHFRRMNTNNKSGELEGTLLRASCRYANLKNLLSDKGASSRIVRTMVERLDTVENSRIRGFRLAEKHNPFGKDYDGNNSPDPLSRGEVPLLEVDYRLLCEALQGSTQERNTEVANNAVYLEAASSRQMTYFVYQSTRHMDSHVFAMSGDKVLAGTIQRIFRHRHQTSIGGEAALSVYIVLEAYTPVPQPENDPYLQYGLSGGFLCRREDRNLALIRLDQIQGQVTLTDFEQDGTVHILPLSKDMLSGGDTELIPVVDPLQF